MQNNPMGAMMPQGVAPAASTGLNFQSDPSMRAQFKGFMSGMQAKQPAPMAPMMQQPLPMPPSMQNVDIFQPSMPMQMAMGGAVPRQTMMGGMPHMLSYITPGEAAALSSMGGSGKIGPGGVPSFSYEDEAFGGASSSAGFGGSTNFSSGGYEDAAFGGSDNEGDVFYDTLGNTTNFSTTTPGSSGGGDDGSAAMDALAQALANTAQVNAAEQARQQAIADPALSGRFQDIQAADTRNTARTNIADTLGEYGTGAATSVKSIRDSVDAAAQGNLLDTVFDSDDYDRPVDQVYDPNTTVEGVIDSGPIGVPPEVQSVRGLEGQAMGPFNLANRATPEGLTQNVVSGPTSRPDGLGPSSLGSIGVEEANPAAFGRGGREAPELGFGLGGMGAEGEAVPAPSSAVQQAADKARAEALDITGYDPDAEVPGIFTTAKGNAAMDKLLDRAQNFKESGIGGFLNKVTGGRANFANRMASDIIDKGYTPIFDNAGNIVATRNPETGQLGAGSVEARIPGMAGSGGGGGAPQMSVADQVAAALKRLGIGEDDEGDKAPPMVEVPPVAGPGLPILPPVNPPTEAAQVGNPLGLGYGQISGLTPNLNSAADDFLRLLGGEAR